MTDPLDRVAALIEAMEALTETYEEADINEAVTNAKDYINQISIAYSHKKRQVHDLQGEVSTLKNVIAVLKDDS